MESEFEMSMMGELIIFLGLQINKTPQGTMISQEKYIKELLNKFNMSDTKSIDTPIRTSSKMDVDDPSPSINETMYRGIIVSILYDC